MRQQEQRQYEQTQILREQEQRQYQDNRNRDIAVTIETEKILGQLEQRQY